MWNEREIPASAGRVYNDGARGYLGHRRSLQDRLALAVAHYEQRGPIERPTLAQVAAAYRVPLARLVRARQPKPKPTPTPSLAEHLAQASASERIEAARTIGVDVLWDTMLMPVLGGADRGMTTR